MLTPRNKGYLLLILQNLLKVRIRLKPKEALLRIAQDMTRILDGLYEYIKKYIEPATTLHQVTFCQLVQDAMKVENSEISDQERSQKKKGKRAREYQAEQVHGSPT